MKKSTKKERISVQVLLRISICFILLCMVNLSLQAETPEITSTAYKIEGEYISKIKGSTTVKSFKENVVTEQEMVFTNKKGKLLGENDIIGTEMKLTLGDQKYTLIVRGDVDGNGVVNATDLSKLKLYKTGKLKATEVIKKAGDINCNGELDDDDIEKLNNILVGIDIDDEFSISNAKTYNEETKSNVFYKNEKVIIRFNSENTEYYAKKMKVNGKEYEVTKNEDIYEIVIDGFIEAGNNTINLEETVLNNGQKVSINEKLEVIVLKDKPTIEDLVYEEEEKQVKLQFTVVAEDFDTIDGTLTITDEYGNETKTIAFVKGDNEVIFDKLSTVEYYDLKFTVTYHDGKDNYEDELIKEEQISVNGRAIEMKDITGIKLYKKMDGKVKAVYNINISELENLNDYIVKVEMKDIKSFFATIKEYKEEDGKLKFVLNYENIVQYDGDEKSNQLEVEFGDIENGVAENNDLETLINKIKEDPNGTFNLSKDYYAFDTSSNTVLIDLGDTAFTGTINGNGHKIYSLNKPLFNKIEGVTIENLILEDVTLAAVNSNGTIANIGSNVNIKNVHVKNLNLTSKADATAGLIGMVTDGTIEECSVTNCNITTSGHIRIAGIVGYMSGGTIRNCYVSRKSNINTK